MNSKSGSRNRSVVIGLDGTPCSFLNKEIAAGRLVNIAEIASRGTLARMVTETPAISSVAWSSFMTGCNPGEHGIFGFTDRKPGTYDLYFPNYSHLQKEPFWDALSREGKRCCVLNVPSTYPARPLNGVLVSGFVAPNIERATYPKEALEYLQGSGYRIDVDASKAAESLDLLLEDLHETLEKRREAILHFWRSEPWDLFVCVFTGTDRLHHFMWRYYEDNDPVYGREFLRYYERVDEIIGEFTRMLDEDTALFMLSDHGFCTLKKQVYINHLLKEEGLLAFSSPEPKMISQIDPGSTQAYCMDPGRIYVNLAGREPEGTVRPGAEYDEVIARLVELVSGLADENGSPMVESVERGPELYFGPLVGLGPDLVVNPHDGYDFKGSVSQGVLTDTGHFTGMHTRDDAMLLLGEGISGIANPNIRDVAALIRNATGIE